MKVLFDQGTPVPLRKHLLAHQVSTAYELGWATLQNGELMIKAEMEGFEVLVTTDQNLKYQQDLASRKIGIVVLSSTSWPRIQMVVPEIQTAVESMVSNGYVEVKVPSSKE